MMDMLNNQDSAEMDNWEKLKRLRRIRERNERIEQQKADNHWNFLAGSLVAKYLKNDLDIQVYKGKDAAAMNAISFAPLENILSYLAAHKEFTDRIKEGKCELPPNNF